MALRLALVSNQLVSTTNDVDREKCFFEGHRPRWRSNKWNRVFPSGTYYRVSLEQRYWLPL